MAAKHGSRGLAYLSIVYDVSWRTLCRVRNETSCFPTAMAAITQSQGPDLFRASCLYIITYNTVSVYSMFSPERAKAMWTVHKRENMDLYRATLRKSESMCRIEYVENRIE